MSNDTSKSVMPKAQLANMTPLGRVDPDKKRLAWNPWLGIIFAIVLFYGAQFIAGIGLSVYPALQHWTTSHANDWLNNSTAAQFVYILIAETITIAGIVLYIRRHKQPLSTIGLKKPRLIDPVYGIMLVPVYYFTVALVVYVASQLFHGLNINQKQELGFNNVTSHSAQIYAFFSLVVLPPIAEEILFRGFLYKNFKRLTPTIVAVLITSLIFGAGHLLEGGSAGPLYIGALQTFVLSLFLLLHVKKQIACGLELRCMPATI